MKEKKGIRKSKLQLKSQEKTQLYRKSNQIQNLIILKNNSNPNNPVLVIKATTKEMLHKDSLIKT